MQSLLPLHHTVFTFYVTNIIHNLKQIAGYFPNSLRLIDSAQDPIRPHA